MKIRIQTLAVITFAILAFALLPIAQAVVPPPDGGYPGFNTAEGQNALSGLTTGIGNTAVGWFSLFSNNDGSFNTAVGAGTLLFNVGNQASGEGTQNTAIGTASLLNNTTGGANVAGGVRALFSNTTGSSNIAIGSSALPNNASGNFNIAVGAGAGGAITNAFNCIAIGHQGANVSQSCFIGNIRNAVVAPDAMPVLIDSAGKLGTTNGSSRRFKTQIKPIDKASEAILALKPVTFCYTGDNTSTLQFGLIAEDVVEVNPELTVRDKTGELVTVRYDAVNAMLLNEFLKEHRNVQELKATLGQQQKEIAALIAHIKEQDAKIQRVSDQLEMNRAAPQVATR
jgi:hypothetical protein